VGKNKRSSDTGQFIKQSIDDRLIQTVVLLNRQYEIIQYLSSKREPDVLNHLENAINSGTTTIQSVYPVYEYVYSLIDNLVRYQKIFAVMPKISQKEEAISRYNRALFPLKEPRNQIQHINNDIDNSFFGPLLGSICWNRDLTQYVVSLGDIGRSRSIVGIPLDTQTGIFVAEFCFIYNETYHDLHKAILETAEVHKWLSNEISITIDDAPYDPNSHFHATKFITTLM
jgi:hypothetical protein